MNKRQLALVEFSEKIYHSRLRHKGINGSLYEDIFIKFLREDIPNLSFYKGQILDESATSLQYDIMICKKETPQEDFIKDVNQLVNIVERKNCLGVIELKKWAHPKMILEEGTIQNAYYGFKASFPELKYFFVTLRFKDRKKDLMKTWKHLNSSLKTDGNFCFFGRVDDINEEWKFPWANELIKENEAYFGEYERLLIEVNKLQNI